MAPAPQTIARELALGLLSQRWEPRHLSPSRSISEALLIQHCLDEAKALQEAGQASLSLELLSAAQQMGLQSPWLLDHQARAMVSVGRCQAAWELWRRIESHSDPAVAEQARAMVARQESQLLEALTALCRREGWAPRYLTSPSEGGLVERLIKEITAARELNAAQLSLDLASTALAEGWENPWLHHHRARALVLLNREAEALPIWRELQRYPHPLVAETAATSANELEQRVALQHLEQQCEQLVREGQPDNARHLLLNALVQDPDSEEVRRLLARLIRPEPHDLLSQELEQHEAALAVHEGLLDALESRFKQRQPQH